MAEKEYIEREAAVEKLNKLCDRVCQYSKAQRKYMCGACPLGDAFTVIEDDIPAADVRPVKWTLCEEKQPPQGRYLCVKQLFNGDFSYDVCSFAEDLSKVDKYDFPKNLYKGIGGWFDYDSETGYFQTSVYAWMPLPPAPQLRG